MTVLANALALVGCTGVEGSDKNYRESDSAESMCADGGIVGWGDSLTYSLTKSPDGWNQANPTWLQTVSADLGVTTKNFGKPSEGSAEIAVRQGGLRPSITLLDNTIPSGTTDAVPVVSINPNDGWSQYSDAGTMEMRGTLEGVTGSLQHSVRNNVSSFSFVPDAPPDEPVLVKPMSAFSGDEGAKYRRCVQIIWAGTNNYLQGAAITRDIASMINWMPSPRRYLIIGTISSIDHELMVAYGSRYVNLTNWLSTNGLAAAGIDPTPDDIEAMRLKQIPPSLRVDNAHLTQDAYTAVGHYISSVLEAARLR